MNPAQVFVATGPGGFPWKEILPHLLWIGFAVCLILMIGISRIREMLSRATKISVAGLELELKTDIAKAMKNRGAKISNRQQRDIVGRLIDVSPHVVGTRILWVDNNPRANLQEMAILRRLGALVDVTTTASDAGLKLQSNVYNLVISDMRRGADNQAGMETISAAATGLLSPPVLFYVGSVDQTKVVPGRGIADRPDNLFDLVADVIDEQRT